MTSTTTRDRLLIAAEEVLRADGVGGLSVRNITARAGTNVASVNYVFGGKEALLGELFARLAQPLTDERIRRLDALPADAEVDQIVRAFIEPLLALDHGHPLDQLVRQIVADNADELLRSGLVQMESGVRSFERALRAALPEIDLENLHFRIRLLIGTTVFHQVMRDSERGTPAEALIGFLVAGLVAPASELHQTVEK
jgi:AcrR family transcriptional regulator